MDDGGLPDAGVTGYKYKLRSSASGDPIKSIEKDFSLYVAAVNFLRDQQAIGDVVRTERERVHLPDRLPLCEASSEVGLQTRRRLVAFLSCFGEQLHDDRGDRRRQIV